MRGHPNPPSRLLCLVYKGNIFLGCVIASTDLLHPCFRMRSGFSIVVYSTTGDTRSCLKWLLRRGRMRMFAERAA